MYTFIAKQNEIWTCNGKLDEIKEAFFKVLFDMDFKQMGVEPNFKKGEQMETGALLEVDIGNTVSIVYRAAKGKEYTIGHIYGDHGCHEVQLFTYVPTTSEYLADVEKKRRSDDNWKYETIDWNYRAGDINAYKAKLGEIRTHIAKQIALVKTVSELRDETYNKIKKLCEVTNG